MRDKDQIQLEEAYKNVREGSDINHSGHGPYEDAVDSVTGEKTGARTTTYTDKQPGMGKKDPLDDATIQAGLAILQQYAQGDISNVEAANKFDELYKNGAGNGPTQDDQYYTKLS
jgi:hypothetical protein